MESRLEPNVAVYFGTGKDPSGRPRVLRWGDVRSEDDPSRPH